MDVDDAMVGRILSRREVFATAARAGLGWTFGGVIVTAADAALQVKAQREVQLVATPALTEGPFFVDEKLKRSDLRAGTKRPAVIQGVPLDLTITVYRLDNGKFAHQSGAHVDLWQA